MPRGISLHWAVVTQKNLKTMKHLCWRWNIVLAINIIYAIHKSRYLACIYMKQWYRRLRTENNQPYIS